MTPETLALAEEQAAKDREILAALLARSPVVFKEPKPLIRSVMVRTGGRTAPKINLAIIPKKKRRRR